MNTLDLNLVRIFDAVLEERSVLRAGRRLGLTQSAVSHALNRLRHHLGDALFVRTRDGMTPTARALEIGRPLNLALQEIGAALDAPAFDPARLRQRIVLAANDVLTAAVVPDLVENLARTAPGVELVVRPATRIDLAEQLDVGLIDVALGVFSEVPTRFGAREVLRHDDVALLRRGHPAARRRLTAVDLTRFPLAAVSLGGPETGAVDGYISERGLARRSDMFDRGGLEAALSGAGAGPARLSLVVPHLLALPMLLARTDAVAIVPRILPGVFGAAAGLVSKPLPYATAAMAVQAVWHRRAAGRPAQDWFRRTLFEALGVPQ